MIRLDAENLYHELRGVLEAHNAEVTDEQDSLLADIATSVALAANEEADKADGPQWGMFTAEGNREVEALVTALRDPDFLPRQQWGEYLRNGMATLSNHGHGEISDTAVREVMVATLDRITEENGLPQWGSYLHEDYLS